MLTINMVQILPFNNKVDNYSLRGLKKPRQKLLDDLTILIQTIHEKNSLVILLWDANETLDGRYIQKFQAKISLVNPMGINHSNFSIYARGRQVIDHMMGSQELLPHIEGSGYLSFYSGAWVSDHRPLFIDIRVVHKKIDTIPPLNTRLLSSKKSKAILNFLNNINKHQIKKIQKGTHLTLIGQIYNTFALML
jgi:hypothetical protein